MPGQVRVFVLAAVAAAFARASIVAAEYSTEEAAQHASIIDGYFDRMAATQSTNYSDQEASLKLCAVWDAALSDQRIDFYDLLAAVLQLKREPVI